MCSVIAARGHCGRQEYKTVPHDSHPVQYSPLGAEPVSIYVIAPGIMLHYMAEGIVVNINEVTHQFTLHENGR